MCVTVRKVTGKKWRETDGCVPSVFTLIAFQFLAFVSYYCDIRCTSLVVQNLWNIFEYEESFPPAGGILTTCV